jgi:hypothetical protein
MVIVLDFEPEIGHPLNLVWDIKVVYGDDVGLSILEFERPGP